MTTIYQGYVYEPTATEKAKILLQRLEKVTTHNKVREVAAMYLDRCGEINDAYVRQLGEYVFDAEQELYSTKGIDQ